MAEHNGGPTALGYKLGGGLQTGSADIQATHPVLLPAGSQAYIQIALGCDGSDNPICLNKQMVPPFGDAGTASVGLASPCDAFTASSLVLPSVLRNSLLQDSFSEPIHNSFSERFTARSINSFSSSIDSDDSHKMRIIGSTAEVAFTDALGTFSTDGSFTSRGSSFSGFHSAVPCEAQLLEQQLVLQQQLAQEQHLAEVRQLHLQLQMLALQQQQQQLQQAKQLGLLELQQLQPATLEQLVAAAAIDGGGCNLDVPRLPCQDQTTTEAQTALLSLPVTLTDVVTNSSSSFGSQQPLFGGGAGSSTGSISTYSSCDGTAHGSTAAAPPNTMESVLSSLLFNSTPALSTAAPHPSLAPLHQQQPQPMAAGSSTNHLAAKCDLGSFGMVCNTGSGSSGAGGDSSSRASGTGVFIRRCPFEGMVRSSASSRGTTAAADQPAGHKEVAPPYTATTGGLSGQTVAYSTFSNASSSTISPATIAEAIGKKTTANINIGSDSDNDVYTHTDQLAAVTLPDKDGVTAAGVSNSNTQCQMPQRSMQLSWDQGRHNSSDGLNRSSASLAAAAGGLPACRHSSDNARQIYIQATPENSRTATATLSSSAAAAASGITVGRPTAAAAAASAESTAAARCAPSWAPKGWNPKDPVVRAGPAAKKGTGAFIPGVCLVEAKPAGGTGAINPT